MSTPAVPFSDPPWLMGLPSPYYTASHKAFQKSCREFIHEHLGQYASQWEEEQTVPEHIIREFAEANMLAPNLPAPLPVDKLRKLGLGTVGGGVNGNGKGFKNGEGAVDVADWDYLHGMIYFSEMNRCGLNGPASSITVGYAFGIPPILKFGNSKVQDKFLPELLLGQKRICIAITEPDAGSDVANITTTAEKTKDGKHYIINGTKKWITNGVWSDYASMAVRTGGKGAGGLSVIVVPLKDYEGVDMRRLKVQGAVTGGTTFIDMEDVKVPVDNLLGEEGQGMKYIMTNFNHERLVISVGVVTQARVALSTAMAYVMKREAFGKPLIDQPVVRHRLAKCAADLESTWSWVESFVYQMCHLKKEVADVELGGLTALAKAKAGMVLNECAQCATLLFGGNGITRTGQGEIVEKIYREVMLARIPGGSEDVLMDLSVRQLVKNYEKKMKELEKSGGSKL